MSPSFVWWSIWVAMRDKSAGKLLKVITAQRKQARRHFKQCLRLVRGGFSDKKLQKMQAPPAVAVGVATNLDHEPSSMATAESSQHS